MEIINWIFWSVGVVTIALIALSIVCLTIMAAYDKYADYKYWRDIYERKIPLGYHSDRTPYFWKDES